MRFVLGLCVAAVFNVIAVAFVFGWPPSTIALLFAGMLGLMPGAVIGQVGHQYMSRLDRLLLACVTQSLCTWVSAGLVYLAYPKGVLILFVGYVVGQMVGVGLAIRVMFPLGPRPRPNHCAKCGYCLTGLPEPRCPECGAPFQPGKPLQ